MIGNDGYLRVQKLRNRNISILYAVLVVVTLILMWIFCFRYYGYWTASITTISSFLLIKIFQKLADGYLARALRFRRGLDGEDYIRAVLWKLSDNFTIIANVMLPNFKSNLDFVAIGNGTVYIVEVKNHRGNVTYNGNVLQRDGKDFEYDFLRRVKGQALELRNYIRSSLSIDTFVIPVIVFSNWKATMHFGKTPVDGVIVLKNPWLNSYLEPDFNGNKGYSDMNRKLVDVIRPLSK
jgi:hypothetical protein